MATIEDVAKKSGVSKALVSRYLNHKKGVSLEKKRLIAEAIEELGYRRNDLARSLVTKKTETIGVILDSLCYVEIWDLIKGLNMMASQLGYNIIYCDCSKIDNKTNLDIKLRYIDFLTHNRVDGIVLYGSFKTDKTVVSELISSSFPFVLIENDIKDLEANKVLVDNRGGVCKMVDYFCTQGYRDIRYVCWDLDTYAGQERYQGYLEGMRQNGLSCSSKQVYGLKEEVYSKQDMLKLIQKLLNENNLPEVFLFGCDQMAFHAILAFRYLGLEHFSHIRLGGFDNDYYVDQHIVMPRLTTIEQPLFEMGQTAIEMLVQSIQNSEAPPQVKLFSTKLIVGDT
ncbi:MAG: LacI family DNA-binding transcriptional regulator [Massiliimalia sp.]|jgi:DNA-binding LacI/PurR family transcriptional regulator